MRMAACAVPECLRQGGGIGPVSLEPATVHEKCRRALYPASHSGMDVALNARAPCRRCQIFGHCNRINTGRRRILDEVVFLQRVLVFKQEVVHCPERILTAPSSHGLGGFRCRSRVRVYFGNRRIPEYESDFVANILKDLLEYDMREATVPALVVAILNQRDRCIGRAAHMIVRTNWPDEHGRHRRPAGAVRKPNDELTQTDGECDTRTIRFVGEVDRKTEIK